MTVDEALSEGYTHVGTNSTGWQALFPINDLTKIDLDDSDYYLASKTPSIFSFDKTQISELLADIISDNESNESGRDTDEIYDSIKSIDFSEAEAKISEVLKKHPSFKITNIKLTL